MLLSINDISRNGGTQSRAEINTGTVVEYAEIVPNLPEVIVFHDGRHYWLADGFHRVAAFELAGHRQIPADVRQGTRRDAILYSCGANATHGLRRTNEDKRRAVLTLLRDAEWNARSNNWIADACGVSLDLVNRLRKEVEPELPFETKRTGMDGRKIETTNIGRKTSIQSEVDILANLKGWFSVRFLEETDEATKELYGWLSASEDLELLRGVKCGLISHKEARQRVQLAEARGDSTPRRPLEKPSNQRDNNASVDFVRRLNLVLDLFIRMPAIDRIAVMDELHNTYPELFLLDPNDPRKIATPKLEADWLLSVFQTMLCYKPVEAERFANEFIDRFPGFLPR